MEHLQEVINMLQKGRNSAQQLDTFMQGETEFLVQEIVGSLSRAINNLETQKVTCAKIKKTKGHSAKKTTNRRRAGADSCKKIVRETSEDSYMWRKYGEKRINGLKYPRCYYRCTYKNDRNCQATKQVQQSTQNPSIYEIFYSGTHTCINQYHQQNQEPQNFENSSLPQIFENSSFPQNFDNSSFQINFGNLGSETSTQSTQFYSSYSPSLMQNTATSSDLMWLETYVADCAADYVASPSVDSSCGSFTPNIDFDEEFLNYGDSFFVDQFDTFLPTI